MASSGMKAPASQNRPSTADNSVRRVPGDEGIWVFILGDLTIFTAIFGAYLYSRGTHPVLFEQGQHTLDQGHGVLNTLILLLSSLFVAVGVLAIRRLSVGIAAWLFAGAILCGLAFVAMKIIDYTSIINHDYAKLHEEFYTYFFALTGLHLMHVIIGMSGLIYMFCQALRPDRAPAKLKTIVGWACIWHMVDLLWIIIFPLLYLVK